MISEKEELFTSFWDLMDFSAGFSLILNSDFTIKLINKSLAEQIFDGERSLIIGKNWLDFVVEDDMSFRSLCPQGFAQSFFSVNR